MGNKKIKIGVVGCGFRISTVLGFLLKRHGDAVEITALFDPAEAQAKRFQKDLAPDAKCFSSVEGLLANGDTDWITISSWNCFHVEQAIAALKAGKNVFCEKPLSTTMEDTVRMQDAMRNAPGRMFFFGLVLRYTPIYQKIKELIATGILGKILSFEFSETLDFNHGGGIHGNWRRDRKLAGTHLLEKCCHDIDIANWLVDSLPVAAASFGGLDFFKPENRAFAQTLGKNAEGNEAYATWGLPGQIDPFSEGSTIVDNQVCILQYANGARATFHTNCNAAIPERRMYILGSRGAIRADAISGIVETKAIGFDVKTETCDFHKPGDGHYGGDPMMADALYESMVRGKAPLASLEDGVHSAVSCFGIDAALDSGHVVDMRPMWERVGIKP